MDDCGKPNGSGTTRMSAAVARRDGRIGARPLAFLPRATTVVQLTTIQRPEIPSFTASPLHFRFRPPATSVPYQEGFHEYTGRVRRECGGPLVLRGACGAGRRIRPR